MTKYEKDLMDAKEILEKEEKLGRMGKLCEVKELLENSLKQLPDNMCIKYRLMRVYESLSYKEDEEFYLNKLEKLALELKETEKYKYKAIASLAQLYYRLNRQDEIIEDIKKLPSVYECKTWLMPYALRNEERIKGVQQNFTLLIDLFLNMLYSTYGREMVGKRDKILLKAVDFINIIFENGDYGIMYNHDLQNVYYRCARDQAYVKNNEKVIYYLKESIKYARIYDDLRFNKKTTKHTSFLVDRLEDSFEEYTYMGDETLITFMKNELEDKLFAFMRETPEFKQLLEELNKE